jgi:serine/threonine protein phosphatase PrpC
MAIRVEAGGGHAVHEGPPEKIYILKERLNDYISKSWDDLNSFAPDVCGAVVRYYGQDAADKAKRVWDQGDKYQREAILFNTTEVVDVLPRQQDAVPESDVGTPLVVEHENDVVAPDPEEERREAEAELAAAQADSENPSEVPPQPEKRKKESTQERELREKREALKAKCLRLRDEIRGLGLMGSRAPQAARATALIVRLHNLGGGLSFTFDHLDEGLDKIDREADVISKEIEQLKKDSAGYFAERKKERKKGEELARRLSNVRAELEGLLERLNITNKLLPEWAEREELLGRLNILDIDFDLQDMPSLRRTEELVKELEEDSRKFRQAVEKSVTGTVERESFEQMCPNCELMVQVRDSGLIGKKIDCPRCKYKFLVEDPGEEEDVEESLGLVELAEIEEIIERYIDGPFSELPEDVKQLMIMKAAKNWGIRFSKDPAVDWDGDKSSDHKRRKQLLGRYKASAMLSNAARKEWEEVKKQAAAAAASTSGKAPGGTTSPPQKPPAAGGGGGGKKPPGGPPGPPEEPPVPSAAEYGESPEGLKLKFESVTLRGGHTYNEDSHYYDVDKLAAAVCDGAGGGGYGAEIASAYAKDEIRKELALIDKDAPPAEVERRMEDVLRRINKYLKDHRDEIARQHFLNDRERRRQRGDTIDDQKEDEDLREKISKLQPEQVASTTAVAMKVHQGRLHFSSLGDSALLRIAADGTIEIVNEESLDQNPTTTSSEALGGKPDNFKVFTGSCEVKKGDKFLLLSDGFLDILAFTPLNKVQGDHANPDPLVRARGKRIALKNIKKIIEAGGNILQKLQQFAAEKVSFDDGYGNQIETKKDWKNDDKTAVLIEAVDEFAPVTPPPAPEAENQDDALKIELEAVGIVALAGDNVLDLEDAVYEALESDAVANWQSMSVEQRKEAVKVALGNIKKKAASPPPPPPPGVPPVPEAKEAEKPFEVGNVQVATEASEAHPTENQDAVLEDKDLAKKRGIGVVCDGVSQTAKAKAGAEKARDNATAKMQGLPDKVSSDREVEQAKDLLKQIIQDSGNKVEDLGDAAAAGSFVKIVEFPDGRRKAIIGQVGDTRVYSYFEGKLTQITFDQNKGMDAAKLARLKELQERLAADPAATLSDEERELFESDDNHTLTQWIGKRNLDPEMHVIDLRPGEKIVLMSDGISGPLADSEMEKIIANSEAAGENSADNLVSAARQRNASGHPLEKKDDKSVQIIDCYPESTKAATPGPGAPSPQPPPAEANPALSEEEELDLLAGEAAGQAPRVGGLPDEIFDELSPEQVAEWDGASEQQRKDIVKGVLRKQRAAKPAPAKPPKVESGTEWSIDWNAVKDLDAMSQALTEAMAKPPVDPKRDGILTQLLDCAREAKAFGTNVAMVKIKTRDYRAQIEADPDSAPYKPQYDGCLNRIVAITQEALDAAATPKSEAEKVKDIKTIPALETYLEDEWALATTPALKKEIIRVLVQGVQQAKDELAVAPPALPNFTAAREHINRCLPVITGKTGHDAFEKDYKAWVQKAMEIIAEAEIAPPPAAVKPKKKAGPPVPDEDEYGKDPIDPADSNEIRRQKLIGRAKNCRANIRALNDLHEKLDLDGRDSEMFLEGPDLAALTSMRLELNRLLQQNNQLNEGGPSSPLPTSAYAGIETQIAGYEAQIQALIAKAGSLWTEGVKIKKENQEKDDDTEAERLAQGDFIDLDDDLQKLLIGEGITATTWLTTGEPDRIAALKKSLKARRKASKATPARGRTAPPPPKARRTPTRTPPAAKRAPGKKVTKADLPPPEDRKAINIYKYYARDASGDLVPGEVVAENEKDAKAKIAAEGLSLVDESLQVDRQISDWDYTAIAYPSGEKKKGTVRASSDEEAKALVRDLGLFPESVDNRGQRLQRRDSKWAARILFGTTQPRVYKAIGIALRAAPAVSAFGFNLMGWIIDAALNDFKGLK